MPQPCAEQPLASILGQRVADAFAFDRIARRRAGRHKAGDRLPDRGTVGCERLEQRHVGLGREHGDADVGVAVHGDVLEHRTLCEIKRVFGQVIEDEGGGPFVLRPIRC